MSGDAVRQSPGSTPLGRSILSRRVWRPGCGGPRRASETAGGVPRARGRRVYSEADPGGYYLSALGGRGRRCRCAERSETAGGARRRPAVPSARHRCRAEIAALRVCVFDWASSFGCEGNVPLTHHCSAKGPVVRLDAHHNRRRGRGQRESPRSRRARQLQAQEDLHTGAAVPEGRSAQGGGAADGSRDPQSRGRLGLQATGGFMLHPIRKASSRTPLLSSRATAASIKNTRGSRARDHAEPTNASPSARRLCRAGWAA